MNQWTIAPIALPAFAASLMVLALRHSLAQQRIVSLCAAVLLLATTLGLFARASDGVPHPLFIGAWPAPYGIVLVLDRLSAAMLLLTAALGLAVLVYAMHGWDRRGPYFHPLFQFQLLGLNGAFLTGDLFNLFVFFEVMLIASYGLMLHAGGRWRLKAGFQYVVINLVASTVFLFAVGLIYAATGTLNLADLAVKISRAPAGDEALLRAGAALLYTVFAVKSALVPLHWWLPAAYAAASAPAAALFAILTKVGAYSIIRVHTLMFGAQAGATGGLLEPLLLPAALITLGVGAAGALAARRLLDLVVFSVIASMGTLLVAVGAFDVAGLSAGLYYLVHSTAIAAALFLLVDIVAGARGPVGDLLRPAAAIPRPLLHAGLFLLAGMAMVGLPPLSGFVGKLLILEATRSTVHSVAAWTTILATTLMLLIGYARAGSAVFWTVAPARPAARPTPAQSPGPALVVGALLGATALLGLFAGPVLALADATAQQLLEPQAYIRAVLGARVAQDAGAAP